MFTFEQILNNSSQDKVIHLLGKLSRDPTGSQAIAILSKKEFTYEEVRNLGKSGKANKSFNIEHQDEYFHNLSHRKYWIKLADLTLIHCELIYPAT